MSDERRPDYSRSVFVNCPFDEAYRPLFEVIIFTIADCGFRVRSALEVSDSGLARIERLYRIIRSCRLDIHDLSRNVLSETAPLPRFNMPLELGIFLGAKTFGDDVQSTKVCLVLDRDRYQYQRYISDIAGQDIAAHGEEPRELCRTVRDWLSTQIASSIPTVCFIWDRYVTFTRQLDDACLRARQRRQELSYADYIKHVAAFPSDAPDVLEGPMIGSVENPTRSQVESLLGKLPGGDDSFPILSKSGSGLTYIQTHGGSSVLFIVEYQDGAVERHFRARGRYPLQTVIDLFVRYAERDETWLSLVPWERYEL
jgi:hypothetical protein